MLNKIAPRVVLLSVAMVMASHANADVAGEDIKTSTAGKLAKLAWPFIYMGKVSVVSRDSPKLAEALAASFEKSGYKMEKNLEKPTYEITRQFRGKASDYNPPKSDTSSDGGWGSALFTLGLNLLIGQKMGVINTDNILQSNANALADTARRASDAYGNPGQDAEHANVAEKVKAEKNLVVYRVCAMGSCAYTLAAGSADLEQLDEACYKNEILKLAGQD